MISLAVIGLGNPGSEYEKTRHNVGFMAVDLLQKKWGTESFHEKKNLLSEVAEAEVAGKRILLCKPSTFMNLSGNAVQAIMQFYKLSPEQCIVMYDDIDLPLGSIRIRSSGSSGTHNGMRSICGTIGTNFPRLRIGIDGRAPEQKANQDLADYVLGAFNKQERGVVDEVLEKIPQSIEVLLTSGISKMMDSFNA